MDPIMDPNDRSSSGPEISFDAVPGQLPSLAEPIPPETDHVAIAQGAISNLSWLSPEHLTPDALWKDLMALTGRLKTISGPPSITKSWSRGASIRQPTDFEMISGSSRIMRHPADASGKCAWVAARFSFRTQGKLETGCSGLIRLVPSGVNGEWKIWILTTILEEVTGWGNPDILEPLPQNGQIVGNDGDETKHLNTNGVSENGVHIPSSVGMLDSSSHPASNHDQIASNGIITAPQTSPYDVLIIGGGMAGLSILGRLAALSINNVCLVDPHGKVGMNWTTRYRSLKLHTAKDYVHLPFCRTFGPDDPYFLSAEDLAMGYQRWVDRYGLADRIMHGSVVERATWDDRKKIWSVTIVRPQKQQSSPNSSSVDSHSPSHNGQLGETARVTARHLVFATGPGGQVPRMPAFYHDPSRSLFRGTLLHSTQYISSHAWRRQRGVVVGSGNTAHDVANDMLLAGLSSVTMVQRNATEIMPIAYYVKFFGPHYDKTVPTELSDRESLALPCKILREQARRAMGMMATLPSEQEYWEALERSGFKVNRFSDPYTFIFIRQGGHHLDVGVGAKVARGEIKIKNDARLTGFSETGLRFDDGSALDADVVVLCTGFQGNMKDEAIRIVGEEIGSQLADYLGIDEAGDLRGVWTDTGREFHYFSLFLPHHTPFFFGRLSPFSSPFSDLVYP